MAPVPPHPPIPPTGATRDDDSTLPADIPVRDAQYTEQIREYYQQAAECAQQADAQMDSKVKHQFLVLMRRWLLLANHFKFKS